MKPLDDDLSAYEKARLNPAAHPPFHPDPDEADLPPPPGETTDD